VPTPDDLGHADARFRIAYVLSTVREGPPKDPRPLLDHLTRETNRAVIHEILRATSWAKQPAPEDYLERTAATMDETVCSPPASSRRIASTSRAAHPRQSRRGLHDGPSRRDRNRGHGSRHSRVGDPDDAVNWVLFWSTEDVSEIAVFATSGGATYPVTVIRQDGIVGVAFRRSSKALTLQALGNKVRPVFSAALRAAP
jgi:hypothetical protein